MHAPAPSSSAPGRPRVGLCRGTGTTPMPFQTSLASDAAPAITIRTTTAGSQSGDSPRPSRSPPQPPIRRARSSPARARTRTMTASVQAAYHGTTLRARTRRRADMLAADLPHRPECPHTRSTTAACCSGSARAARAARAAARCTPRAQALAYRPQAVRTCCRAAAATCHILYQPGRRLGYELSSTDEQRAAP